MLAHDYSEQTHDLTTDKIQQNFRTKNRASIFWPLNQRHTTSMDNNPFSTMF